MFLFLAGDYCGYNVSLIPSATECLSSRFNFLFCLDFSISRCLISECITCNSDFTAFTYKEDISKYFFLNSPKHVGIKFLTNGATTYNQRVLQCYFEALQHTEYVLFLGFSLSSPILKVAEFATEMNKIIFCIPGDLSNRFCSGSNFLLKTGNAIFIDNFDDIANYIST